ncbi:MAG: uncharacterized protein QOI64_1290 [Solirubrobacteraceae bacterium]|nr:uncharacterized protein [Solirubrobacteraceae bacterium]
MKSLAGERLDAVDVREDGLPGDRALRVEDARGEQVTARTKPALLALAASLNGGLRPLIDGRDWESPETAAAITAAAGDDARLVPAPADGPWFDESPLLVATDGAIADLGYDGRRFRPNIVIGGVDGMAERGWDGRRLRAGSAEIDLGHLCERCVLTTFDPDSQEQDPDVLRRVNAELDGLFARNCWVARPGRIAVGDPVELL